MNLAPVTVPFALFGEVSPLHKAVGASAWIPTRPLGGWMATYGKIGPNGGIIPTVDRDDHIFEAAGTIGKIDFTEYLAKGLWNDTHTEVIVGVPSGLEFCGPDSPLAKAHSKVGFWTEGHLFDRRDPRSWLSCTTYEPTSADLDQADYYWHLATMLKGMPRSLGFSAEGKMQLSPCGHRIIYARVARNSVCELPVNPDSIATPLRLAREHRLVPDMVGKSPCADCRCPWDSRCKVAPLAKGVSPADAVDPVLVVQDLEDEAADQAGEDEPSPYAMLQQLVIERTHCTPADARRWIAGYLRKNKANVAEATQTEGRA